MGAGCNNCIFNVNAGGIVTGRCNRIATSYNGYFSIIGGGCCNSISNGYPYGAGGNAILAGRCNKIQAGTSGGYSTNGLYQNIIAGGFKNCISGSSSNFIGAGNCNTVRADHAFIGSGTGSIIETCSNNSSILAGCQNIIQSNAFSANVNFKATNSSILGGHCNKICAGSGSFDGNMTIAGGSFNCIYAYQHGSNIGGGKFNRIYSLALSTNGYLHKNGNVSKHNVIGGGYNNKIADSNGNSSWNAILGGGNHLICVKQNNSAAPWQISYGNTIVGGNQNRICTCAACGRLNTVVGGTGNNILCDDVSVITGGSYNCILGCALSSTPYHSGNFIGAGSYNRICCNSTRSFIGGGYDSIICRGSNSNIIGGRNNRICSTSAFTNFNSILGGTGNIIQNGACWNSILGGCNNNICGASVCYNVAFGCDIQIGCGDTNICYNAVFGCDNNICCCGKFNIVAGDSNTIGAGSTSNDGQYQCSIWPK